MLGIEIIDREATLELLNKAGPDEKGLLRTILCGGVPTQSLAFKQGKALSENCPLCGNGKQINNTDGTNVSNGIAYATKEARRLHTIEVMCICSLWHLHTTG